MFFYERSRNKMANVIDGLEAWGCNVPEAMNRFLQDEGLYVKCLYTFTNDASFESLDAALGSKNYKQAFEEAHTLKGVSAYLSLTPLYNAVCRVVEDLRHESYETLDEDYAGFREAYQQYLKIMGDKD